MSPPELPDPSLAFGMTRYFALGNVSETAGSFDRSLVVTKPQIGPSLSIVTRVGNGVRATAAGHERPM